MVEWPGFQQRQFAFAAHIRNPQQVACPADVAEPRMAVYRELIFNNLDSFLAATLPVLHGLLDSAYWRDLVRDFLAKHRAQSPYFRDIPREFLDYLEAERGEHPQDPPFLRELAHYEWVELALALDDHEPASAGIDPAGDLFTGHPQLSPLAWPLQYRFPVHRLRSDYQPLEPPAEPTYLLVYRDADDAVHFLELNPVSARLAGLLAEHADATDYSGRQALETIACELHHPRPEQIITHGLELLQDWCVRGILLGTRRNAP